MGKSIEEIRELYAVVEDDCNEAIGVVQDLKKGILYNSVSDEQKRKMCDKIIEILKR